MSIWTKGERLVFPAVSVATARRLWTPLPKPAVFRKELNGGGADGDPTVAPSSLNETVATATLSVALAAILTTPLRVLPLVGCVIVTVGGWVSAASTKRVRQQAKARQTQTLGDVKII